MRNINNRSVSREDRYRLQGITRNASERGEIVELSSESVRSLLASARIPSPPEQADLLLAYLDDKSAAPGQSVFLPYTDYPVIYAKGAEGLIFIARSLVEKGLLRQTDDRAIPQYAVTLDGYAHLDAKRKPKPDDEPAAADIDGLTGLRKREAFDRDIPKMVEGAKSDGAPLALVMVDIDHFKKVNDTHGHPKGDAVLKGVAEHLARAAKHKGRAYRYGGEEMAVLLPNHTVDEAVAVAERARAAIDSAPVADVKVAASFGVACYPEHASDAESLKEAADKALYDAKHQGRNCVRLFGESPPAMPAPRLTPRRLPAPTALSDEERERMRVAHFQGVRLTCPRDRAHLNVRENREIGQIGGLFVDCYVCGLHEELPGVRQP